MGVPSLYNLLKDCHKESFSMNYLKNGIFAWDIEGTINRMKRYGKKGSYLDEKGQDISHVVIAENIVTTFVIKYKVAVILVFGDSVPACKLGTLKIRNTKRKQEKVLSTDTQHIELSKTNIKQIQEHFIQLGFPVFVSESEADVIVGKLCKIGIVDGVVSNDFDAFCYGANLLINYFPDKEIVKLITFYDVIKFLNYMSLKNPSQSESELTGLTFRDQATRLQEYREKFIHFIILMGCDYCPAIENLSLEDMFWILDNYKAPDAFVHDLQKTIRYCTKYNFQEPFVIPINYLQKYAAALETYHLDDCNSKFHWNEVSVMDANIPEMKERMAKVGLAREIIKKLISGNT